MKLFEIIKTKIDRLHWRNEYLIENNCQRGNCPEQNQIVSNQYHKQRFARNNKQISRRTALISRWLLRPRLNYYQYCCIGLASNSSVLIHCFHPEYGKQFVSLRSFSDVVFWNFYSLCYSPLSTPFPTSISPQFFPITCTFLSIHSPASPWPPLSFYQSSPLIGPFSLLLIPPLHSYCSATTLVVFLLRSTDPIV